MAHYFNYSLSLKIFEDPVNRAGILTFFLAVVVVPYWWLAVLWSRTVFTSPDVRFTFETTTFLLVLVILDGIFLSRYYQVKGKRELNAKKDELKRSVALYRSIFASSPDGIVISDNNGTIRMFSSSVAPMYGYNGKSGDGEHNILKYLHPEDIPIAVEQMKKVPSGKTINLNLFRGKKQDGSYFPIEVHSDVIRDEDGNPTDYLYIIRDVTERESILSQLKESEELFHTVFQEISDPLLIFDENGVILDTNRSCVEQLQITKNESEQKEILSCGIFHKEDTDILDNFIRNSHNGGYLDIQIIYPEGNDRFSTIKVSSIRIRGLTAKLLLIHDIDEIKRVQNALSQANNQLTILNSITRHDIVNCIMIISSYCELLREQITDTTASDKLLRIYESSENIKSLIEFTREYQDLGGKKPVWQDISSIVTRRSILSLLEGITVTLPREKIEIFADPMFEKVIYNLIDNSCRHGGQVKNITISYQHEEDRLLLIYRDDGIGIPVQDKPKLFKKGFGKNTGLGLFLIREILNITHISIRESGEPGKGATFIMSIPHICYRNQNYLPE